MHPFNHIIYLTRTIMHSSHHQKLTLIACCFFSHLLSSNQTHHHPLRGYCCRDLTACGSVCDRCAQDHLQHPPRHLPPPVHVRGHRGPNVQGKIGAGTKQKWSSLFQKRDATVKDGDPNYKLRLKRSYNVIFLFLIHN